MVARVVPVPPFDLIVVGATGDLARRKILPALYHRLRDGQITDTARVIGVSRREMDPDGFRALVREALDRFVAPDALETETVERFLGLLDYAAMDSVDLAGWERLSARLGHCGGAEAGIDGPRRPRAIYMSVAPSLFAPITSRIAASGIADEHTRIVVEKPLGHDLASARALNAHLASLFEERQVYRIDHYLGKETVQNLMALRFANLLFEPLWNARRIDHVQITVAETVGVEGRGATYDSIGAMRDMVQNHMLQLLCLTAMEPPRAFTPDEVRDEKLKVLKSLAPITSREAVVRGQYRAGNGLTSYVDDVGNPDSRTESFVALKVEVDNWRWAGVPFYLRTGKRLRARVSEIAVYFKEIPHSIFAPEAGEPHQNVLAIRLQPDEGINLGMTIKDPGPGGMRLVDADLDMTFAARLGRAQLRMPDAYERLVMDVIRGDQTLFMRGDEVEAAWAWTDPVIEAWEERGDHPRLYDPGSTGPEDSLMLLHRDRRRWRDIAA